MISPSPSVGKGRESEGLETSAPKLHAVIISGGWLEKHEVSCVSDDEK